DVLTVTGDPMAARGLATGLARQLVDAGVRVAAVGEAADATAAGAQTTSMAEVSGLRPQVIFCGPEPDPLDRRVLGRSGTLVVLVGGVRPGRWSVVMTPMTPMTRMTPMARMAPV